MAEPDQRALWREARQHISEYEAKASELALDLQVEQKALTLAREQLATTQREVSEFRRLKGEYERKAVAEHRMLTDLARAREAEVADTQRVAHQLAAATAGYEEEKKKQADMKQHFSDHLRSLEDHLAMLTHHAQAQAAGAAAGQEGAAAVGQMQLQGARHSAAAEEEGAAAAAARMPASELELQAAADSGEEQQAAPAPAPAGSVAAGSASVQLQPAAWRQGHA